MGISGPRKSNHLVLENLTLDPVLARRLPRGLACRYCALPVAEDKENGCLTVAMADPDDNVACEALKTVLDTPPYVVRCDPAEINARLAEIWPQEEQCLLRVLVCTQDSTIADEVQAYMRGLCDLLGASIDVFQVVGRIGASLDALAEEVQRGGYQLVILLEPDQSPAERLFLGPVVSRVVDRVPASLLIARRPRWPLRRMLLVAQGKEADDSAVDWIVRLARPSGATVTVLTVVPPLPAMYNWEVRMQQGLAALLATNTALGRQLRRIARRLVDEGIEGTLRLREGPPDWQIRHELIEGDYDLIAITAETRARWLRRLVGEVTAPLLGSADRPVLVVKPKSA
jgi:nucleotide-binding universal stress UspA family protein